MHILRTVGTITGRFFLAPHLYPLPPLFASRRGRGDNTTVIVPTVLSRLPIIQLFSLTATGLVLLGSAVAATQTDLVLVDEFTQGTESPDGWKLSGGTGCWLDRQRLQVTGGGNDSNFWRFDGYTFEPRMTYRFRMRARRASGTGGAISGPTFANRDFAGLSTNWRWFDYVFRAPESTSGAYVRLGQWHATGDIQFDAVEICPALPVHAEVGTLQLGDGEVIRGNRYTFQPNFGGDGSNTSRPLRQATAGFNSNRWTMGGNSEVRYEFQLNGFPIQSGQVSFTIGYHQRGGCVAEVSSDGDSWHAVANLDKLGTAEGPIPASLLPAGTIYLRLKTNAPDASFQIYRLRFEADLDGTPPQGTGRTVFADVHQLGESLTIEDMRLAEGASFGQSVVQIEVRNNSASTTTAHLSGKLVQRDGDTAVLPAQHVELKANATTNFDVNIAPTEPGTCDIQLTVSDGHGVATKLNLAFFVPDYFRSNYGAVIEGMTGDTAVWWCNATNKVPRQRILPRETAPAACLAAAKNDFEAVQIVVRPEKPLLGLTAACSGLSGADGAHITADEIEILQVYYHFVEHPTDATGVRADWPDALPPLDKPIDVAAGENQPLWILVHVPTSARAGEYTGTVELKAEGFSAAVPLRLRVWDFALPERNHLQTAFGLSMGNVFRYHQAKTDAQRRQLVDYYLQCFADHRISPYDPTPLDPIRVRFLPEADPPRAEVDFRAFDKAMTRAVEQYHFTGFRLPIQGMGGGTFHARYEPKIDSYGEDTPQYKAMFSSYVQQLESHLREKGWLEMVYVYWFDEPDPKDYQFVRDGMQRLKTYAPGLPTMLTEEPVEALAGPIDIWCPVSPRYEHQAAEARRAHGEQFWWYVCCYPKTPYCTLFIDHPATELRNWFWQTWKRDIVGTLVWQSNYWTSSAAYPDEPQNPYEDPMGYVSGYSTPKGTKRFWGNGDGRFIYPPLAAAVPGKSGSEPVLQRPVSSIRWEMLREGVEDYEMLYLLRELLEKQADNLPAQQAEKLRALLVVPESITTDMTTFSTDSAPIYAQRAAVALAIEQLLK